MATAPTYSAVPVAGTSDRSYVDWPAILAGAILSVAVSFVLITFGSGLGLSMLSAEPAEGVSLRWVSIAAGIWFIWVAVSSFAAGAYLTGRLRRRAGDATEDEVETRDGAHGVLVWATGAVIGALMAASGVSGLVGAAASGAGAAAGTVAEAMEGELDYYAGRLLRGETGTVLDNPEVRSEVGTILARSLAAGEVTPAARDDLVRIIASAAGIPLPEAEAQVDAVLAEVAEARAAAVDAIEQARTAAVIASFVLAATMLASAAASYTAATFGGSHRDQNVPFRTFGR